MPGLTKIIRATATRMAEAGIIVDIDRCMAFVSITCEGEDDITMQGDEADQFIAEVDKLYNKSRHVTEDEAALCHAEQYCENIWN